MARRLLEEGMPRSSRRSVASFATLALVSLLALGLTPSRGGGEGNSSKSDARSLSAVVLGDGGRYFPFDAGSVWTYAVEESLGQLGAQRYERTVRVTSREPAEQGEAATFAHAASDEVETTYDLFLAKNGTGISTFGTDDTADVYTPLFAPYWDVRFDLPLGSSFVQFDRAGVQLGEDYDADGENDVGDFHSEIELVGIEPVSVPAGDFAEALLVRRVTRLTLHFSRGGVETMSEVERRWFAKDVGLAKVSWALHTESDGALQSSGGEELEGYAVAGRSAGHLGTEPAEDEPDLPSGMSFAIDADADRRGPLVVY